EVWSSVNNAVSDNVDFGRRRFSWRLGTPDRAQQMLDRLRTRRNVDPILLHDPMSGLHNGRRDITIPLNPAFPHTSRGILRERVADFKHASLLTAGTRIENQDLHE